MTSQSNQQENKCADVSLQINMDDYCGDNSEEKNPYPANDYIGKFINEVNKWWISFWSSDFMFSPLRL